MGSIDEFKLKTGSLIEENEIVFQVNGQIQKVKNEYPIETSLSTYLRDVLLLTGTKTYCNEGGCGSCTINGRKIDPTTNEPIDVSINSCIFPLYSCNGWQFTTVEGIGNKQIGINPIQKRLADANGSQCGYCSPGFVMNMYNLLKNNPKPTKQDIEKSLDGNICRCTGYRAILDSMKSFADDPIDIEDLGRLQCLNSCSTGGTCQQSPSEPCAVTHIKNGEKEWYQPKTLDDLSQLVKNLSASNNQSFKFISANTARAVYKSSNDPVSAFVNLQSVNELSKVEVSETQIKVGSGVTLSKLIDLMQKQASSGKQFRHLSKVADHLELVGSHHIRNIATWAGNVWLKKLQPEFPSDVLISLEAANAQIVLLDLLTNKQSSPVSLDEFLNDQSLFTESSQKHTIIHSLVLPSIEQDKTFIKSYKVMQRPQNCHAYVSTAFRLYFDDVDAKATGKTSMALKPSIVFNGISEKLFHAKETEKFLMQKDLTQESVFGELMQVLSTELRAALTDANNNQHSSLAAADEYLLNLALSLFYKFVLTYLLESVPSFKMSEANKSAIESLTDCRRKKESKAEHGFQQNNKVFPVTKPIAKLNAYAQTSGETKYVNDLSKASRQLQGAFVLTKVGNATIDSINLDTALKQDGVVKILLAKDIPGVNNVMGAPFAPEVLFVDKKVEYAGQPLGLVLAETFEQASRAAQLVEVTYKDVKKPILTIKEAIAADSYHQRAKEEGDIVVGDAAKAIENAKNKLSGEIELDGSQYHFYLEGICSTCEPTDDGYKLELTTQWMEAAHRGIVNVLGLKNASCVDIQVKQIGGGFGGKSTRPNLLGAASALAVYHTNRPVKINLDLNTSMLVLGKRPPWYVKYTVGFDDEGKLEGIVYDWYTDPGCSLNGSLMFFVPNFFDSAYKCPNYFIKTNVVNTNKPASTEMRAPDIFPLMTIHEHLFEHIATHLKRDPLQVRRLNFYTKGDSTVTGLELKHFHLDEMMDNFMVSTNYQQRKAEVDEYNRNNKWKKRGIALTPVRYNVTHNFSYYNALVSISRTDGSVAISHGGVEMGQGIHTKVAQMCAYELGIPIEKISVKSTNNLVNPNTLWSGGSVTSELCGQAVVGCCKKLLATLEPIRQQMPENYTWEELVAKAFASNCQLSEMHLQGPTEKTFKFTYDAYACSVTEVIVDILTGELELVKTEILSDCGQSLNGLIDIGQAEGGFMIGLGYWLLEKTVYDPKTGLCLNNGTWDYKPPLAINLPTDFKINLLQDKPNPVGILGSKAIGEPAVLLSNSIIFALRNALASVEKNKDKFFELKIPATPENVQLSCKVDVKDFTLN